MPKLTIKQNNTVRVIDFVGEPLLGDILAFNGFSVARPCGGRGLCGKCAVSAEGKLSEMTAAEVAKGTRLACQTVLLGDCQVTLEDTSAAPVIQTKGTGFAGKLYPIGKKLGAAVDIGTTTVVVKLCDQATGETLSDAAAINPQTDTAADVMGRIDAAMNGKGEHLKSSIEATVEALICEACEKAGKSADDVDFLVITGNTTMLYLLQGLDPKSLSRAPFEADNLFDEFSEFNGRKVYLPPCMNAFVGADITCAILAGGIFGKNETALLCDIGTNGEIALYKEGKLYVTSTAAGPAFEGAGISCGCGSIPGAIDKVWAANGQVMCRTIGGEPAVGICGSGLIDAVAAFLQTEQIDETGAAEEDELPLTNGISLLPKDVRAVQLAKAAITAGIETVLDSAGVSEEEIDSFYIAGGFGSHLDIKSAVAIGLVPGRLQNKVKVIGNAAISGAEMILLDRYNIDASRKIAAVSTHVNLGGNPKFNESYMEHMMF